MPQYNCKHPTCNQTTGTRGGYCDNHAGSAPTPQADYDRHQRDRRSKAFYNSERWSKTRLSWLARHPTCDYPGCHELARHVHHIKPVAEVRDGQPWLLYDGDNLQSLCIAHHNMIERGSGERAA
jgi:hypothetical protein